MCPPGAENGIFWDNYVNTTAADALVAVHARPSATIVLTMADR